LFPNTQRNSMLKPMCSTFACMNIDVKMANNGECPANALSS
jgi:hypothetical protein